VHERNAQNQWKPTEIQNPRISFQATTLVMITL